MSLLYKFQEGGSITKKKINDKEGKKTLSKEDRDYSESTNVTKPKVKSLEQMIREKNSRVYKEQPVISQGKKLTEQEQKTSDKINKRLDSKKKWENTVVGDLGIDPTDIGVTGGNIASKLTRFTPMSQDEIIKTTNNPKEALKLSGEIALNLAINELAGGLLTKPLGIAYSAGANMINRGISKRIIPPGTINKIIKKAPKTSEEVVGQSVSSEVDNLIEGIETIKPISEEMKKEILSKSSHKGFKLDSGIDDIKKKYPQLTDETIEAIKKSRNPILAGARNAALGGLTPVGYHVVKGDNIDPEQLMKEMALGAGIGVLGGSIISKKQLKSHVEKNLPYYENYKGNQDVWKNQALRSKNAVTKLEDHIKNKDRKPVVHLNDLLSKPEAREAFSKSIENSKLKKVEAFKKYESLKDNEHWRYSPKEIENINKNVKKDFYLEEAFPNFTKTTNATVIDLPERKFLSETSTTKKDIGKKLTGKEAMKKVSSNKKGGLIYKK